MNTPLKETITIALTDELVDENVLLCHLLKRLGQAALNHINVSLVLIGHGQHLSTVAQLTKFSEQGVTFNKVVMCSDKQVLDVMAKFAKVMSPDIIMTSKLDFAKQCKQLKLPTTILTQPNKSDLIKNSLHFAFDGDSVLFCHQSQYIADGQGIDAFEQHEQRHQNTAMGKGPLFEFIRKIDILQTCTSEITWSLVTARGAKALNRAINTLEKWQLSPIHCFFMEGGDKTPVLISLNSDMFFDDHPTHCQRASDDMLVGHVQC